MFLQVFTGIGSSISDHRKHQGGRGNTGVERESWAGPVSDWILEVFVSVRKLHLVALCFWWLLSHSSGVVHAQVPTSTINGIVTDSKGAVVVNAQVTIVGAAQGLSRETQTNGSGVYVFPDLPPGLYDLKIEESGF